MKLGIVLFLTLACIVCVKGKALKDCSSLEKLNLSDLLEKSKECRDETRKVFENKYVDFKFLVRGAFVDEDEAIEENGEEREIFVYHFEVIKRVLDTFGDLMSKIDIDFADIDAVKEGKEIVQHLNGIKLEVLALRNCKGNVLDEWKNPFPNVVSFWFTSSSKDKLEIKNDKKLHQLLPKLNWLKLDYTKASDWGFFGDDHKELTSFIVELPNSKEQERPDDTHVLSLLKNSKKLESFAVANTNLKLLKGVVDLLPGLKTLIINSLAQDYSDDQVDKVEFSYIKFLWIAAKADQTPDKVYFNGLKSISLNIEPNFNDKWFEFLSQKVKNDAVGSFVLRSETLSREDLLKIVDNLPHLKTIEITSSSKFSAYEIEVFVGDSKELNSLKMDIQMDEPEQTQFSEEFKKHWNVTVIQSDPKTSVHLKITRAADPEPEKGSAGSLAPHSMQFLIVSLVVGLVKALEASF